MAIRIWRLFLFAVILLLAAVVPDSRGDDEDPQEHHEHHHHQQQQRQQLVSNDYRELTSVYEPVWLATLWPKLRNGAQMSLAEGCWRNLTVFFQDMLDGRAWALNAVDSTGRFGSGLLWGNNYWIGSQNECNDLNTRLNDLKHNTSNSVLSRHNYFDLLKKRGINFKSPRMHPINPDLVARMILLDNTPPYPMAFSALTLNLNITKTTLYSSHTILMGICLPKACKANDVQEILDFSMRTYQNLRVAGVLPRTVKISNARQLDGEFKFYNDAKLVCMSVISLLMILLVLLGTVVDICNSIFVDEKEIQEQPTPPTFRSFVKVDAVDSEYPEYSNINFDPNGERILATPHSPQTQEEEEKPPVHTVDGLIPNKYTEVVSGYNFQNKDCLKRVPKSNQNDQIHLVGVKKITNYDSAPKITLVDGKNGGKIKEESIIIDAKYANNRKYVVSAESAKNSMESKKSSSSSLNINNVLNLKEHNECSMNFLVAFSLRKNCGKIFCASTGDGAVSVFHGVKCSIVFWAMLVNTYIVVTKFSDNKLESAQSSFENVILKNSAYLINTFFVLSGLIVSYKHCQNKKKQNTNFMEFHEKIGQCISTIAQRYIRYTPSYIFILYALEIASKYLHANKVLQMAGNDRENCENYWWRNALYINTFFSYREYCMPWSWYVTDDIQFHAAGLLLLVITAKYTKLGILFFLICYFVGWITTFSTKSFFATTLLEQFDTKPWWHISAYIIGLCFGWIISKNNGTIAISKKLSCTLWTISILIMTLISIGLYKTLFGNYGFMMYYLSSHTFWSLAFAWIVLACLTGCAGFLKEFFSSHCFHPIGRLSHSAFLLHPLMLEIVFISSGSTQNFSFIILMIFFFGVTFATFLCSLLISLVFESPILALLKKISSSENIPDKEEKK